MLDTSKKIRLDISCELSAMSSLIFFEKKKKKKKQKLLSATITNGDLMAAWSN